MQKPSVVLMSGEEHTGWARPKKDSMPEEYRELVQRPYIVLTTTDEYERRQIKVELDLEQLRGIAEAAHQGIALLLRHQ